MKKQPVAKISYSRSNQMQYHIFGISAIKRTYFRFLAISVLCLVVITNSNINAQEQSSKPESKAIAESAKKEVIFTSKETFLSLSNEEVMRKAIEDFNKLTAEFYRDVTLKEKSDVSSGQAGQNNTFVTASSEQK